MKSYCIKEGYQSDPVAVYGGGIFQSKHYQVLVYEFAAQLIEKEGLSNILDIGCGFAKKLDKYINPVCNDITGIDLFPGIAYCKKTHIFGEWFVDNVENSKVALGRKFDVILASDIVEHLDDPDKLFEYIRKYSTQETYVIISTPERDVTRGSDSFGPPSNCCHVREWNTEEFKAYAGSQGLLIQEAHLVKDRLRTSNKKCCQLFLMTWRKDEL